MDRKHVETHLRLLAEAELRRAMKMPAGSIPRRWHPARLALVAQALTAVGAVGVMSSEAASRRSSAGGSSEPAVATKMAQCSSQGVPGFPCHYVAGLAAYRFGIGGAHGGLWTARRMPFLARLHVADKTPAGRGPARRAGPPGRCLATPR
jgi:hypothetical protein